MKDRQYSALVIGATGSVGEELVAQLLATNLCFRVTVISRTPLPSASKMTNVVWPDFSEILLHRPIRASLAFKGHDVTFCCLGASRQDAMRLLYNPKKFGPKFRAVDHDFVIAAATAAKWAGVPQFSVVSSLGANPRARFAYSRIKGQMEQSLRGLRFERLSIFRPSQLIRSTSTQPHWLERFGMSLVPFLNRLVPAKYRSIEVTDVAKAMKQDFENSFPSTVELSKVLGSETMQCLANG